MSKKSLAIRPRRVPKREQELSSRVFDLEKELFESQQFEQIASGKLTEWVRKHDEILIAYKELKSKYEPIAPAEAAPQ